MRVLRLSEKDLTGSAFDDGKEYVPNAKRE